MSQGKSTVEQLEEKIGRCYKENRTAWLKMTPEQLLDRCEEIEAMTRMAKELPSCISEKDAAYLLRFVNPLEVVSDAWVSRNGSASLIMDDEVRDMIWELADRGDAEVDYELEPVMKHSAPTQKAHRSDPER